ncbi:MAG: serine/threonine protein kinase [Polyangiaceae bacterium]|nr:serine/threonine protein kinase [Polyangiaceae bacterium]
MADEPPPTPIAPGTLVGGRYRLDRVLQAGGMGVVYEARHEVLEQRVAVKVMLPEITADSDAVERFLREARAAAKLRSDHVVKVLDVGTHEGLPYLAMEFLEGSDLSAVASRGALPPSEAVSYVLQALEAIGEAHAAGIVHRDLKPSNLFLETRAGAAPRVKVLDFGISKVSTGDGIAARLTNTRAMLGSPAYMSPEQVRSTKAADARSDIWALGVILWELLTGEGAFDGDTIGEIFSKIREEPLAPVHLKRPGIPAGLCAVVARAVERDREQRYQTVAELRAALWPYAGGADAARLSDPGAARVVIAAGARRDHDAETLASQESSPTEPPGDSGPVEPKGHVGVQTAATWSQSPTRGSGRKVAFAAGGLALGGVLTALAVALSSSGGPPRPSATPEATELVSGPAGRPVPPALASATTAFSSAPVEPASSAAASASVSASASASAAPRPGGVATVRPSAAPPPPPPTATGAVQPPPPPKDKYGI